MKDRKSHTQPAEHDTWRPYLVMVVKSESAKTKQKKTPFPYPDVSIHRCHPITQHPPFLSSSLLCSEMSMNHQRTLFCSWMLLKVMPNSSKISGLFELESHVEFLTCHMPLHVTLAVHVLHMFTSTSNVVYIFFSTY